MSVPGLASRSSVRPHAASAIASPGQPAKMRGTAQGQVQYIEQPKNGEELYAYITQAPEGQEPTNMTRVQREITVTDVRPQAERFTLAKNGFELHKLKIPSDIDWQNEAEVRLTSSKTLQSCLGFKICVRHSHRSIVIPAEFEYGTEVWPEATTSRLSQGSLTLVSCAGQGKILSASRVAAQAGNRGHASRNIRPYDAYRTPAVSFSDMYPFSVAVGQTSSD